MEKAIATWLHVCGELYGTVEICLEHLMEKSRDRSLSAIIVDFYESD